MNTRIRYTKDEDIDNLLISKDQYKIHGSTYEIHIKTDLNNYGIYKITDTTLTEMSSGSAKTLNELKIKAKKALQDLGIEFKSEIRNRLKSTEV